MITNRDILDWIPPAALRLIETSILRRQVIYRGAYSSWASARRASEGYDAATILATAERAAYEVIEGRAAYDRDGVTFPHIEYQYPLLAALLRAACTQASEMTVLDFGGGLGSTYRQCRPFFRPSHRLTWNVVEQPQFAAAGKARFQTPELRFFDSLPEAIGAKKPSLVLASSVLQYLESPTETLRALTSIGAPVLVIDRTAVTERGEDLLTIQHVPASLYGASTSYPVWCLSKAKLLATLAEDYRLLSDFSALDPDFRVGRTRVQVRGFILEHRTTLSHSPPPCEAAHITS